MRCLRALRAAGTSAEGPVYRGLRSARSALRYMSQHHLLDSDIHLASFDDHYLYDSLSLRIDTVQQDNRQLAKSTATIC